jgi:Fibronectin type III domain
VADTTNTPATPATPSTSTIATPSTTSAAAKHPKIKPLEDFNKLADGPLIARATAVVNGVDGNNNFTNLPVSILDLRAGLDSFTQLAATSLDGSKKVIAARNKARHNLISMLRMVARYVEIASKGDMAVFKTSGLQPAATAKVKPQPVNQNINSIDHGTTSGTIVIRLKAVPQAWSSEFRYGVSVNGAPPAQWTVLPVTTVKNPITLTGLTPGTNYAFQVRTLSKKGYSDWSDSAMFMAT